jgi:Tol biopolymer transport system component
MPDVQEVFRMATQKVRPEAGFTDRQLEQQRRRARNRKAAALALMAALGVAAAVFSVSLAGDEERSQPAVPSTPPPAPSPAPDDIYTIDLNSGEMTPLPETLQGGDVSPDGTMLAYDVWTNPDEGEAYIADIDGTGVREIGSTTEDAFGASWSPDGSLLVYQGRDSVGGNSSNEVGDLYVLDVTTGEVRQITDLGPMTAHWFYLSPSFSPDGRSILYQMARDSDPCNTRWDLWTVPVAGGESTIVRRDAAMGRYSPDGRSLAYLDAPRGEGCDGASSSLWLADADGADPRLLVDQATSDVRWSPDGTRIAFSGDDGVHVVDVATGESVRVGDGSISDWLDDDTLVVAPSG